MSSRAVVLVATIGALAVASGCTDSENEPAGRGAGTQSGHGAGTVETTAADEATETDRAQTRQLGVQKTGVATQALAEERAPSRTCILSPRRLHRFSRPSRRWPLPRASIRMTAWR